MKHHYLIEDKLPPKLPVVFSSKISNQINVIYACNQNNTDALSQWDEYIEGLKSYISNPVIAWDYNNRYVHFPNGAIHLMDLGYDVSFIVKTNQTTNENYVYVFMLNLKPEEFGLKVPSKGNSQITCNTNISNKKLIRLTEQDLHRIVRESVNRILRRLV